MGFDQREMSICIIDGCDGRRVGRGWCRKHYNRWRRTGDPLLTLSDVRYVKTGRKRNNPAEVLAKGYELNSDGCFEWQGSRRFGYGHVKIGYQDHAVHRLAWETFVGPIPTGMTIHHHCENPPCYNLDHLEPMSLRDNLMESDTPARRNALKTHCPAGHAYDEANTYIIPRGGRACIACSRQRTREWRTDHAV